MGILEVLIPLTASDSIEVQGNSAAAIGNLSAKADDYTKFNEVWLNPEGGLQGYLIRFLESQDKTFQHIAVWTIVQFLEGGDPKLASSIKSSSQILPLVNKLAASGALSGGGPESDGNEGEEGGKASTGDTSGGDIDANEVRPSDSISQNGSMSDDEFGESGEAEIPQLAKRILEMM